MSNFQILAVLLAISSLGFCSVGDKFGKLLKGAKCMGELGCFYIGPPYFNLVERPISVFPKDRDFINTKFYLHTEKSGRNATVFSNLDRSIDHLTSSGFNSRIKTRFIISGYQSPFNAYWKEPLIELLLQSEECNVFLVDWEAGAGNPYEQAVANTRVVGAEIALFIQRIKKRTKINLASIHLIGHSLGAHAAGYAGKRLNKIGHITALDPAGPYFTNVDPVVRLDRNDARFVDAIHTNAALTFIQGFGLIDSIADLDFWPNGGHYQPGCPDMGFSYLTYFVQPSSDPGGRTDITCNHDRAIDLYSSSIKYHKCKLEGPVCNSYQDFNQGKCRNNKIFAIGLHADVCSKDINRSKSLNIYFNTSSKEPFCSQ